MFPILMPAVIRQTDLEVEPLIGTFAIQKWFFESAQGRFDLDLAESGVQFLNAGDVRIDPEWPLDYSQDRGLVDVRRAIAEQYSGRVSPDDGVVVTHGAQEALYLFYRSFLEPGDHVITTVPGWQQSWEVPRHMGCDVTKLPWTPGEPFGTAKLKAAVRSETRLFVLNSPGNPSGCVISPEDWAGIQEVAEANGIWIVGDEEFEADFSRAVVSRHDRGLSVSGLSKMYGFPGLRVGWAADVGAEGAELIERMVNYKRYTTMCNSLLCEQIAADVLKDRARYVQRSQELLRPGLARLTEFVEQDARSLSLVPPQGTPFAWIRLPDSIASIDFAERLLAEQRVLVMPAEVFGAEHGLRLTYARPLDTLSEGLARIEELLSSWK
jgi:aspartate/methionine/tyrosine aminotransferase